MRIADMIAPLQTYINVPVARRSMIGNSHYYTITGIHVRMDLVDKITLNLCQFEHPKWISITESIYAFRCESCCQVFEASTVEQLEHCCTIEHEEECESD